MYRQKDEILSYLSSIHIFKMFLLLIPRNRISIFNNTYVHKSEEDFVNRVIPSVFEAISLKNVKKWS